MKKYVADIQALLTDYQDIPDIQYVLKHLVGLSLEDIELINSLRGKGNQTKCTAPIPVDTLFYKCFECSDESTHVYCQQCFQANKHPGHIVTYHYSNGGCCDCGDYPILKKESFCDQHAIKEQHITQNYNQLLSPKLQTKIHEFLQCGFALLFSKIESFAHIPSFFENFLLNYIESTKDIYLISKIQQYMQNTKFVVNQKQSLNLYTIIFKVLEWFIQDNIIMSEFIGAIMLLPLNEELQTILPLRHKHSEKLETHLKIEKQHEKCGCSILQNFIRFHVFLDDQYNKKKEQKQLTDKQDFSVVFFSLHSHVQFKKQFCEDIVNQFCCLLKPITSFSFRIDFSKLKLNKTNLTIYDDQELDSLLKQILAYPEMKLTYQKDQIYTSQLYEYLYQFMGQLLITLSEHKDFIQIINYYNQQLRQIPLCMQQSFQFISKLDSRIYNQLSNDVLTHLAKQLANQLNQNHLQKLIPSQLNIENNFLINFIVGFFPFKQSDNFNIKTLKNQEHYSYGYSLFIQLQVCVIFKKLLIDLYNQMNKEYPKQFFINLLRISLFKMSQQISRSYIKNDNKLQELIENIVLADRLFQVLLCVYYEMNVFQTNTHFLEDLLKITNLSKTDLQIVMNSILERRVNQLMFYVGCVHIQFYNGQRKVYKREARLPEGSLLSMDLQYFQLYSYLYGAEGMNEIIEMIQQTSIRKQQQLNTLQLMTKIIQTDYDYTQTCSFLLQNQISQNLKQGYVKLFQSIFCGQTYYSYEQIYQILENMGFDNSIKIEELLLCACELNEDNRQLQLKKEYCPPNYEPLFFENTWKIKEQIIDKLRGQHDESSILFGSAFEQEIQNYFKGTFTTLTPMRLSIIQQLLECEKQHLLNRILTQLQNHFENKQIKAIEVFLEENAIYLNMIFVATKYFKVNNEFIKTKEILKIISDIHDTFPNLNQNTKIILQLFIDKFIQVKHTGIEQVSQQQQDKKQQENKVSNKKLKIQNKFKAKQTNFEAKIDCSQITQTKNTCNICQMPGDDQSELYHLILIQPTSLGSFRPHLLPNNDEFQLIANCCQHRFHRKCLIQQFRVYSFHYAQYFECPVCFTPFNLYLPILKQENNENIIQEFQLYLDIIDEKLLEFLMVKYISDTNFEIQQFIYESVFQILQSLLHQMLSDSQLTIQKQQHSLIQGLIKWLSVNPHINYLNQFLNLKNNKTQILMQSVIMYLIINSQFDKFRVKLSELFSEEQCSTIEYILGNQQLQVDQLTRISSDNKTIIMEEYKQYLQPNFKEFYLKHGLSYCKLCNFYPKLRLPEQEQNQYICLVCMNKFCGFSCGKQIDKKLQKLGNLNTHAIDQHHGKSVFLCVQNSQIIILISPFVCPYKMSLFQKSLGQPPQLRNERLALEQFKLNQKALESVLDIIIEEKYVNFIHSYKAEAYKKKLL